ncbi:MAG: tryptophan--tRNA ligase, partial [Candidatus Roizmanbacteria bacterium]|nr:tryptophan--tRNA ligase [Candidatus Roizmanbacteria bacterium]
MKRILSGITPSSTKGLHLGNYLGMVKPAIEFQKESQCFYFVANLHGLNNVFIPEEIYRNTMNIFVEYLAFGVDPEKTTFFVESDIPGIPYLQTILNNAVTVSELKRMHGYKDKLQNDIAQDQIGMGLFSYPVLMAADILLFKPDVIPVGEDQSQHVEIAREIARTFNNRYGDILKIPELSVQKNVARVPGIYGDRKMSKSLGNDIPIFGTEQEIKKQIMSIKTDPARIHPTDPGNPDKNLAFTYFDLLKYEANKLEEMKEKYRKGKIGDV